MLNIKSSKGFYEIILGVGIVAIVVLALLPSVQDEIDKSTFIFNGTDTFANITGSTNNTVITVSKVTSEGDFGRLETITLRNNSLIFISGNATITDNEGGLVRIRINVPNGTNLNATNPANLTYTWTTDQYIRDSSSRTILPYIILFIALALLIMIIGVIKF